MLVSGVGFLNVPRYPDWPGLDDFAGPKFHTARWEHEHDLTGKVVAVVGTGSSATQVVPAIQPIVQQLYVFQREPGWIMPKGERDFTDEERAAFAKPWRRRRERWRQRYLLERSLWRGHLYRPGTKVNEARQQFCLDYIDRKFADRPDLREAVTPKYPYPGKRPDLREHLLLRAQEAERRAGAPRRGVGDANRPRRRRRRGARGRRHRDGDRFPARRTTSPDCASWAATARTLQEHWAGEPRAYLGITVPGFPNFFMIYGPGTNGGEIVTMLESQAEYAVRAMKRMIARARHRGRGEAELRSAVVPLAAVQDGGHVVDDEQQLLHVADRQES